jgi:hypothetical protein
VIARGVLGDTGRVVQTADPCALYLWYLRYWAAGVFGRGLKGSFDRGDPPVRRTGAMSTTFSRDATPPLTDRTAGRQSAHVVVGPVCFSAPGAKAYFGPETARSCSDSTVHDTYTLSLADCPSPGLTYAPTPATTHGQFYVMDGIQ